jgi:ATP-dependent helicase HrpB
VIDFSGTGLPLVPFLPKISSLLGSSRSLALSAEPGAGKSTLVPPYLMDEPWLSGKAVIMLEPRRLAAVSVAARMADLLSEPVGRRAGYAVRTAARTSRETRITVVTEALLTRRIQDDPLLHGVGLVIFDEYHERSIHADLALALALEVRRARPDLAILAMSATLDTEAVAELLGRDGVPAPILHCPGALHPVRTEYRSVSSRWEQDFADGVVGVFGQTEGDILAFLPGAGEIRRAAARVAGTLGVSAEVLPLHGTLGLDEQRRVISPVSPPARRRVILATSIAETSLTVPGVRTVADSGWARLSRFHPATGLDRLVTERVTTAAAEQRRGRAGRLGPGLCVRFWSETERLLDRPEPEIRTADLAGLVLECALWGAREPGALAWIDPPSAPAWRQAWDLLVVLGLAGADGPTPLGRAVAALGLPPRLGVLVSAGAAAGQGGLAAACAALLEERDGSEIARDPDFRLRLELIRSGTGGRESWRRAVEAEMARIMRRLPAGTGAGAGEPAGSRTAGWSTGQEDSVGGLLCRAFPDRLARRDPDGSYRLVTGRMARFPGMGPGSGPGTGVRAPSRAAAKWIVALDADPGETAGAIRLAVPVDEREAAEALARTAAETLECRWEGLVPRGMMVRRAGRLVLTERPTVLPAEVILRAFSELLRSRGLEVLPWSAASRRLLERARFYARAYPERGLGDMSDTGLAERAEQWLDPVLKPTGGQVLSAGGLQTALRSLLGSAGGRLDAEVPESIRLPAGRAAAVEYTTGEPAVEARIQEVFGLAQSPRICGLPVTFRLLSPARRPLQITRDLASFWRTTYAEVRGEMRGRYPKHYWPEDPLQAEPTSQVRPRRKS